MAIDTATSLSHSFSIAKDGKHHDATFSVAGDVLSVIYWGPEGVTLRKCPAAQVQEPEAAARTLLNEMI